MLLDGREAVDQAVVGVGLVIRGNQAWSLGETQLCERDQADMPVEQQVLSGRLVRRRNGKWFDQPDIID